MALGVFRMNPRHNPSDVQILEEKTFRLPPGTWSGMGPIDPGNTVRETIVMIGPHKYSIQEEHWTEEWGPKNGETAATVIWPSSAPVGYGGRRHWQNLVTKKGTGKEVRDAVIEELKTAPGRLHAVY
jgi:hypothetical protein